MTYRRGANAHLIIADIESGYLRDLNPQAGYPMLGFYDLLAPTASLQRTYIWNGRSYYRERYS